MGREDGGGKARVGLGRTGTRDWLVTLGGGGFALRSPGPACSIPPATLAIGTLPLSSPSSLF